ncbi:hypothetical protein BN14_09277 [Rhizoctonia solani AG-1 IB]|uniref:DUF6535 domain-containing protein n=1 Tax=Thanatephorus cucumeris (strain AG1-IB / isolate 7/3/14) TaxID=1108050 RepID=M5CFY2_THACB|nr:hypothetical protein BN14_09277 [Rhizoctonia solani AG-1 IB]
MSLFNLTNLLKYPTKPCTNHDASSPETGMGLPSDPTPPHLSQPSLSHRATGADPMMESDEYGAELGKEARVWKVYVKESDRSDTELVDGWNKSLDVILVFAALFSAISTAFLIESSKRLLQDPADVTAQTLLAISQTLSAIANGTQPLVSKSPAGDNTEEFFPSRTMVAINTLWYLSLSLSVATSLLAMLAKDWCHSFMTGRTGPAYNQTLRRQRKWTMIEKWKMQELIMVLPSLIHLSLPLHWVITTCEAPYAVDIALQAIAGAGPKIHQGPQIDRGPLVACKAAPKISKRLASSNFSSAMNTHSFSLYVRALLFIGSNRLESISTVLGGKFTSELQPAIWKLQEQYEDRVAQLIEDGTFQPTNHNVEALRLASSIAIDSLQQITGSKQGSTVPDDMLATSLLWTLCALVSYAGPGVEEIRDRLDAQLRRCTTWGDRATMKRALGYNLISHWLLAPKLDLKGTNYISIPGRLHLFRVVECVVEAGDHITPCIEVAVGEELADVKESLKKWFNFWGDEIPTSNRGLSSFTAYPTRCLPLNEQMSLAPHKAINISTQDLEDDEEDEIHRHIDRNLNVDQRA